MRCDRGISALIEKCAKSAELPYNKMISGPYHDSLFVGLFAPVGMIFVPSRNGISHSPDEWTEFSDIALGTDVLAGALTELSNR